MDNRPRQVLQQIVSTYGAGILGDPRRCRALLMDFCGEYRGEINLLHMALREGIPGDLQAPAAALPRGLVIARLVRRLEDDYFLPEEAARWAVESCAEALNPVIADEEATRVFRSSTAATVSMREWLSDDSAWHVIGATPGTVALPHGVALRISARLDDAGASALARDIGPVGGIQQLDFSYSPITDLGLAPVVALEGIVEMDFSRTSVALTSLSPDSVGSALRELNFRGATALTDDSLKSLAQVERLERLELGRCRKITDAGVSHLADLQRLSYLGLSGTRISDQGLSPLGELPSLQYLDLSGTRVTGAGLRYVANCPMLATLDLFGCVALRPDSLSVLRQLTGLAELRLGRCGMIADPALMHLRSLVGLVSLSLEGLNVSDTGMLYLQELDALSRLDVAWTQIGDAGVARIGHMRSLRDLSLAGARMTDAGLSYLRHLVDLEDLDISSTGITDTGLRAVRGLRSLAGLNLEGTKIHDAGLVHLGELPALRRLYLGDTAITDVGLALIGRITNVDVVDVAMCSEITARGVDALEGLGVRVTQ